MDAYTEKEFQRLNAKIDKMMNEFAERLNYMTKEIENVLNFVEETLEKLNDEGKEK